jgi:hypothetical protein
VSPPLLSRTLRASFLAIYLVEFRHLSFPDAQIPRPERAVSGSHNDAVGYAYVRNLTPSRRNLNFPMFRKHSGPEFQILLPLTHGDLKLVDAVTTDFSLLLNCATDGVKFAPAYRKPFDVIFQRAKNEEWSALADDCRPLEYQL